MVSPLALALLASLAAETAPEDTGPAFSGALEQATYVVLAEIAETHEVAGETVEEATVTQVLKGSLGAGRIFYKADSCGCASSPTKARAGSRVLLLLSPGSEVQERRSFWQALDRLARPDEFFDLWWGPVGRLVPDAEGFVTMPLALPDSVPTRSTAATGDTPPRRLVAFDLLVAWVEEHFAAADAPLR